MKDMSWEWNWPDFCSTSDCFIFFTADLNASFKGDHSPGIWCLLIICGIKLLDFGYYNINHEEY
jgi:hypothetical protein